MRYFSLEETLRLHYQVVEDYGGSHGVRDELRLKALVDAPRQRVSAKNNILVFTPKPQSICAI